MMDTIKKIVQGPFTVKYINKSTMLFLEQETDYDNLIKSIKSEKIAYHAYTNKIDKSHAFVLGGLTKGITVIDIEKDLLESYEIKARAEYEMSTKIRPLFLVIQILHSH